MTPSIIVLAKYEQALWMINHRSYGYTGMLNTAIVCNTLQALLQV